MIDRFPAGLFQGRDKRVVVGQKGIVEPERFGDLLPAGAGLHQASALLQEVRAIEVAAPIEEYFSLPIEAIDQVTAELIGSEDAGIQGKTFDSGSRGDGKIGGGETGLGGDGVGV